MKVSDNGILRVFFLRDKRRKMTVVFSGMCREPQRSFYNS